MPITAVIFDLDGTLVDSAPDIQVAINKPLAEEGRRPLTLGGVSAMIGDGTPKLVERAVNATRAGDAPEDLPTLTRRFLGFCEGHTTDLTRPYPGVLEALRRLRSAGVRMGIHQQTGAAVPAIAARPGSCAYFRAVSAAIRWRASKSRIHS